jgi:hypothetical protein
VRVAGNPTRRRALAAAVCVVLVAAIAATLARRSQSIGSHSVPVLLVPGYLVDPELMRTLRRSLSARGREVTTVVLPRAGTDDIVASARRLAGAVVRARSSRVDLVGFSTGAIVVRAYVGLLGGDARTRRAEPRRRAC